MLPGGWNAYPSDHKSMVYLADTGLVTYDPDLRKDRYRGIWQYTPKGWQFVDSLDLEEVKHKLCIDTQEAWPRSLTSLAFQELKERDQKVLVSLKQHQPCRNRTWATAREFHLTEEAIYFILRKSLKLMGLTLEEFKGMSLDELLAYVPPSEG